MQFDVQLKCFAVLVKIPKSYESARCFKIVNRILKELKPFYVKFALLKCHTVL